VGVVPGGEGEGGAIGGGGGGGPARPEEGVGPAEAVLEGAERAQLRRRLRTRMVKESEWSIGSLITAECAQLRRRLKGNKSG
jgi:hypothetical protein